MQNTRDFAARQLVAIDKGARLDSITSEFENSKIYQSKFSQRDRAFIRLLTRVSLRRRGQIDDILRHFIDRPLPKQHAKELALLRIGVAQLIFLDISAHAAVNATVEAVNQNHLKGLLNAVLRRVAAEGKIIESGQDQQFINTPSWLWNLCSNSYGVETAREIAEAHLQEPPLDLTSIKSPSSWKKELGAEILPTGTLRVREKGNIINLPGFNEGAWWVQDVAASFPALLLLNALPKHPSNYLIADYCAAPGGKTSQLLAAGAKVFSIDRSRFRLGLLENNLKRLGLRGNLIDTDAIRWIPKEKMEAVLIDSPCSASGTIRRHPDLPWRKNTESANKLIASQDQLLASAASNLKPGGILVYSVCSLDPLEGEVRIKNLLQSDSKLFRVPVEPAEIGGLDEAVTPEGDVRTLPCYLKSQGGMDGFFISRLQRKK